MLKMFQTLKSSLYEYNEGKNALFITMECENYEIVELLLKNPNLRITKDVAFI